MSDRIRQLNDFLNENPAAPFLLYALATEYFKIGQVDEALHYYNLLRTDHPGYVGTYYHLGKLYETLGQKEDAITTYLQGMEIAQQKNDRHALAELQAVYRTISGLDDEDDD